MSSFVFPAPPPPGLHSPVFSRMSKATFFCRPKCLPLPNPLFFSLSRATVRILLNRKFFSRRRRPGSDTSFQFTFHHSTNRLSLFSPFLDPATPLYLEIPRRLLTICNPHSASSTGLSVPFSLFPPFFLSPKLVFRTKMLVTVPLGARTTHVFLSNWYDD